MKRKLLALAMGLLVTGVTAQQAQAANIQGAITFGGSVTLNTASANTATAVTGWFDYVGLNTPHVLDRDGSFIPFTTAGVTPVIMTNPWNFNSGAVAGFYTVGGFTFDLISSSIIIQGGGAVSVLGSGTLTGNGFDPTPGTWNFSTQDPGAGIPARFTFIAASGTPVPEGVPEGGSSLAMLGISLVGAAILRKKLAKA